MDPNHGRSSERLVAKKNLVYITICCHCDVSMEKIEGPSVWNSVWEPRNTTWPQPLHSTWYRVLDCALQSDIARPNISSFCHFSHSLILVLRVPLQHFGRGQKKKQLRFPGPISAAPRSNGRARDKS